MTAPRPTKIFPVKPIVGGDPAIGKAPDSPRGTTPVSENGDNHSTISTVSQETENRPPSYYEVTDGFMHSSHATPSPLNTPSQMQRTSSAPVSPFHTQVTGSIPQRNIEMMIGSSRNHGQDSPVMNETLSVIDEHITDLNTPRSSVLAADHRATNDSGSEYSTNIDHRLSYINGNETDEEERVAHSEAEVLRWSPTQVAQYLKEIGVEKRHCEIFKEQEISGEVLLGMDQASVFMKEFDLGLVGRRLRTWHKIKAFQEDIKSNVESHTRNGSLFGAGDASSDDLGKITSQHNVNGSMLPRIPSLMDHPNTRTNARHLRQDSPRMLQQPQSYTQSMISRNDSSSMLVTSTTGTPDSLSRPSAASVRDINHSRRHSSADFTPKSPASNVLNIDRGDPSNSVTSHHKKQPSFDRDWTMSAAVSNIPNRTTAALGLTGLGLSGHALSLATERNTFTPSPQDLGLAPSESRDSDRGYISGGDAESKRSRNVLRKRDVISASHSRQSSYKEEGGSNLGVPKRHSRFGSADSIRDTLVSVTSPASRIYHANSFKGRFRSASSKENTSNTGSTTESPKELISPTVTKLEYPDTPVTSIIGASPKPDTDSPSIRQTSFLPSPNTILSSPKPRVGIRTVSDAVTGSEKALVASPASVPSPIRESPIQSPTRTGSTTTSGASKSFELESTDASSKDMANVPITLPSTSGTKRAKDKKKTSAYTRGLEKKTPQEQMISCDYSGWMKKKSPSLMTTWKPRLFVLRGRRLSYYYTENDTEEKGLIDISSHRVLSADNDRITGLHATVTGAKSSPTSPANAQTPTLNAMEVAAQVECGIERPAGDGIFIFKLVPPRTGLSRAVNFTKPIVHYFAVDNIQQGRLWMAALMKATIDRDETKQIKTTYTQKTISLAKAKAMRQRPPALMGPDEELARKAEMQGQIEDTTRKETGLNIQGLDMSYEHNQSDMDKTIVEGGGSETNKVVGAPAIGMNGPLEDGQSRTTSYEGLETDINGKSTRGSMIDEMKHANVHEDPPRTMNTTPEAEKSVNGITLSGTLLEEAHGMRSGDQRSRASSAVSMGSSPIGTVRDRALSQPA